MRAAHEGLLGRVEVKEKRSVKVFFFFLKSSQCLCGCFDCLIFLQKMIPLKLSQLFFSLSLFLFVLIFFFPPLSPESNYPHFLKGESSGRGALGVTGASRAAAPASLERRYSE